MAKASAKAYATTVGIGFEAKLRAAADGDIEAFIRREGLLDGLLKGGAPA